MATAPRFEDGSDAYAPLVSFVEQLPAEQPAPGLLSRILNETTIGGMLKDAGNAVTLPGDVYAGRVDPMSDEGIKRAFDLAGLVTGGAGAVPAGKNELRAGIKAYHGSPHDFDRFDLSKIGTGEGAQAYGHGLYFAQSEGVARNYRDALSGAQAMVDGVPFSARNSAITREIGEHGQNPAKLAERLQKYISEGADNPYAHVDDAQKVLDAVKSGRFSTSPGRMYEVNINADPAKMLDWDKPLAEQSRAVQEALRAGPGAPSWAGEKEFFERFPSDIEKFKDYAGSELYTRIAGDQNGQDMAAGALKKAGIPGIKYLDAGSRGFNVETTYKGAPYSDPVKFSSRQQADEYAAEQIAKGFGANVVQDGSRNYVVFDDKIVEILRKYGVASIAALPPAVQATLGISQPAEQPDS